MNGYTLIHKMRSARKQYKFSVTAQALYHELVAICNNKRWPKSFTYSNAALCKILSISEPTLQKARLSLINAGLICFQSGKADHTKSSYSFTAVDEEVNEVTTNSDLVSTDSNLVVTTNSDLVSTNSDLVITTKENEVIPKKEKTTQTKKVVTTKKETDYIKHNYIKLSPLIPQRGESECEIYLRIRDKMLTDKNWLKYAAKRLNLDNSIPPDSIDDFLGFIIVTGDIYAISNIREAKRRFYCWWRKHGYKKWL
ncbi:helix-turn-helix domain-containing protein [Bacteroides sp. 519]|uniref:helix-turn-helix domain-containing protein n=1 Tax=Bacteroides sp. 519 TaxID=2302937 RepID=UPI0013D20C9C|nr:helix-turn-helix domain-containing protein [Bacteroides sp. 519]NDV58487.1 hypothetical protein [Bacteroides sp. 519]